MTEDDLFAAVEERVSTRTFDGSLLDDDEMERLDAILREAERESWEGSVFGHNLRYAFYGGEGSSGPSKMGTYGLISGASGFVVAAVEKGPGAMEDFGYSVEKIVLELTAFGFETCWIGGVFSRSKAGQVVGARENEVVPAVIAVGRAARRRSLLDRVVTSAARARQRKPFGELFFEFEGSNKPSSDRWRLALEAVRAAPSASNKQPWRIVYGGISTKTPGALVWRLFLDEDKVYNNALGEVHLQNLDTGIAMRHFQVTCAHFGLTGSWGKADFASRAFRGKEWAPIALWN